MPDWLVILVIAWFALALLVAVLVGKAIRIADRGSR